VENHESNCSTQLKFFSQQKKNRSHESDTNIWKNRNLGWAKRTADLWGNEFRTEFLRRIKREQLKQLRKNQKTLSITKARKGMKKGTKILPEG